MRGLHADGMAHRWWSARVESIDDREIVVTWTASTVFTQPPPLQDWSCPTNNRAIFWPDRQYFVTETYLPNGDLGTIFADIASPATVDGHRILYTDYELDVVKPAGEPMYLDDEDEFEEAVERYGYTAAFQEQCRQAVDDARQVVAQWVSRGPL